MSVPRAKVRSQRQPQLDFDAINRAALSALPALLGRWLPDDRPKRCERKSRSAPLIHPNGRQYRRWLPDDRPKRCERKSRNAPLIHPNGRQYRWLQGHHPLQTPLAELPNWLADLLMPAVGPPSVGLARPSIEEEAGWGPKPAYSRAATLMANQPGRRPWLAREIIEKVDRAVTAGEQHPRRVAA